MKIYQFSESTKSIGKGRQYHFTVPMSSLRIPPQSCEGFEGACGIGYTNSLSRLRMEVPEDPSFQKKWRKSAYRVPRETYLRLCSELRTDLNLPPETILEPGTEIGYYEIKRFKGEFFSFEWNFSYTPIVTLQTKEIMQGSGLTGWKCYPVYVKSKETTVIADDLFEFVITGKGGHVITDPPTKLIFTCPFCGYKTYERVDDWDTFRLDEKKWDGSDFFRFESPYGGLTFMTEKARTYLRGTPLTNWYAFEKPYDPGKYFEEV